MKLFLGLFLVVFIYVESNDAADRPCGKPKDKPNQSQCNAQMFDQDSVVCVCDENYCDSLITDEFPASGQYTLISSDKNGKRFSTETRTTKPLSSYNVHEQCYSILTNNTVYLTVNQKKQQQKILGFGGAFTDAVGVNLNKIPNGLVDQVFNAYYGQAGLRYNLARNPIAHSDYSLSEYYYSNIDYDVNLTDFKIAEEDYKYRIPYIKRAKSMVNEGLLLISSVWTVPAWMRRENDDQKRVVVLEKYYDSYCLYIMKFLEAYRKEGLKHYAVAFVNEPTLNLGIQVTNDVEKIATVWTLDRLIKFADNHFLPALKKQFPETKMLFLDDNRDIILQTWLKVEKEYKSFNAKLELAGFHSYFDSYISPSLLDSFHENLPNVTILTTELSVGSPGNLGTWSYAEFYASSIIQEMNHYTSGWIDWNLVLDTQGQPTFVNNTDNAPIIIDTKKQVFYKQPSYYAIGHFSKFIPRGSTKIGLVSQFATDLEYVCVQRPDGYLVAVLQNKSNKTVNVNIINSDGILSIPATPNSISTVIF